MAVDWRWELLDGGGTAVQAPDVVAPEHGFPSQSDAESWLGEHWPALWEAGVAAVSLWQRDRLVYGPMRITAPR